MNQNNKILIVDDEEDICKLVQGILEDEGYNVDYAMTFDSSYKKFSEGDYDLCILDVWLHDSSEDGIHLLEKCLEHSPSTPMIMMSGHSTVETAVQAIKKGAYDFIEKPFKTDRLLVMVQRAVEFHRLKNENKTLKGRSGSIRDITLLGDTSLFKAFKSELLNAAQSPCPALIYGESGTGKKTAAKYIHQKSRRKDEECLFVHCSHLASDELDHQLFGSNGSVGLLEQANGGTLVLDKISEMPIITQRKLLLFIESGGVIGGSKLEQKKSDVRLVGTYDIDILNAIEAGTFLKDLFYLLNVVPIKIPILSERSGDIPLLINAFYEELNGDSRDISKRFTGDALNVLAGYAWPGNTKQLKNFVEWLKIVGLEKSKAIDVDDLPPYFSEDESVVRMDRAPNDFLEECMVFSLKEAREKFEKMYLQEQLARFGYNISKASTFIGMERSALHRKLRSLDIPSAGEESQAKKLREGS